MTNYIQLGELQIDADFADFLENEFAPFIGKSPEDIAQELLILDQKFDPQISAALQKREDFQSKIDQYFINQSNFDQSAYENFLKEIGYLEDLPGDFEISTQNSDDEIAKIAAPQLVVPINNARFALNAANARFVSLYDALYGTNAIMDAPKAKGFDRARAAKCRDFVRDHLDQYAPLQGGSWRDIAEIKIQNQELQLDQNTLQNPSQFVGYCGDAAAPEEIILRLNGLHIRLIRNQSPVAQDDKAGIGDVIVESALSVIMDCEDSVAAVDGDDKAMVYRNWLGLMRGDLQFEMQKNGKSITRRLAQDIGYLTPKGEAASLKGRALMFVRNVGHLMRNPAIKIGDHDIYEGLMDAYFTIGINAQNRARENCAANSQRGSIYIVKPKMHGSAEVRLACEIFAQAEAFFDLAPETVKIGIMDEERRVSANLAACIHAAKSRVAFINTGFLDRTGDEIHTHMQAGAMLPKGEMKTTPWLDAYEKRNVEIGLKHGLQGKAQIGKGMWAKPDDMAGLLREKIGHPKSGANTAWVPSPTAAAIHALHYHQVDVTHVQNKIRSELENGAASRLSELLTPPLLQGRNLDESTIQNELENNLQGIMGYVVRWVDQGIGCSTVPDIHDIGLMEDRATCRISAQMLSNWLMQGLIQKEEVESALMRVAAIVDRQNADDPNYQNISAEGFTMQAVRELVFDGAAAPSGYTEPALHRARLALKEAN